MTTALQGPVCYHCGGPATCYGSYEGGPPEFACDDCCGHGGEDGKCRPAEDSPLHDDVSFELACSRARTELEDERKRELQDAHCRALDEWARARSRESIADGRDVLRRVSRELSMPGGFKSSPTLNKLSTP